MVQKFPPHWEFRKALIKLKLSKAKIVPKPWGREVWFAEENEYAGKILEINKGVRTSLHYHKKKKETMYILEGRIEMTLSDRKIIMEGGDTITLEPGDVHRMVALEDTKILEASTPELEDVVRIEDDHGRE